MRRGEVWRVRIPFASGHAQAGDRPALIVQNDPVTASLPTVLIVPFTSTPGAARFAGTLAVAPDGRNGLTAPSIALVFPLRPSTNATSGSASGCSTPRRWMPYSS